MLTAKQRRPRLANLIDIGVVFLWIAHRHDDVYRIAKLPMDCLSAAICSLLRSPELPTRIVRGITARSVIGQGIQRRIHTGREVEQLARDARMAVSEPAEIAAGGENASLPAPAPYGAADRTGRETSGWQNFSYRSAPQICQLNCDGRMPPLNNASHSPVLNWPWKKKRCWRLSCGSNHCLRQRFLPRIAGDVQRRIPITHAGLLPTIAEFRLRVGGCLSLKVNRSTVWL